jgi:hypothetical protein
MDQDHPRFLSVDYNAAGGYNESRSQKILDVWVTRPQSFDDLFGITLVIGALRPAFCILDLPCQLLVGLEICQRVKPAATSAGAFFLTSIPEEVFDRCCRERVTTWTACTRLSTTQLRRTNGGSTYAVIGSTNVVRVSGHL